MSSIFPHGQSVHHHIVLQYRRIIFKISVVRYLLLPQKTRLMLNILLDMLQPNESKSLMKLKSLQVVVCTIQYRKLSERGVDQGVLANVLLVGDPSPEVKCIGASFDQTPLLGP